MKNQTLVSIIISNYNYERFLNKAIDSALNQTYENIEVIVVDDGSTDKSREIISSYGNRVISIYKDNAGQPSSYNTGFASSRGEIICFLDSDDMFLPSKVAEIVKIYNSYEEVGWYFHSLKVIDENDNPLDIIITRDYSSCECDYRSFVEAGKIPPTVPPSSALCFKRSLLDKILPMPTAKVVPASDYYVKYMAVALSKGFILAEDLTLQRIHGNNMATWRTDTQHMKAREQLFTGYWVRQQFPHFRKFGNKLVGLGMALNWCSGNKDLENSIIIDNYFSYSSLIERIKIFFIAFYYYTKARITT